MEHEVSVPGIDRRYAVALPRFVAPDVQRAGRLDSKGGVQQRPYLSARFVSALVEFE